MGEWRNKYKYLTGNKNEKTGSEEKYKASVSQSPTKNSLTKYRKKLLTFHFPKCVLSNHLTQSL